jgi:predicted transcriptional regulator
MNGAYKLNEAQVEEIRGLFENTTLSNSQIAELFQVSAEHIRRIRKGDRWNPESDSFKIAHRDRNQDIKNFNILRVVSESKVLCSTKIDYTQVIDLREHISDIFVNQSGGITIVITLSN